MSQIGLKTGDPHLQGQIGLQTCNILFLFRSLPSNLNCYLTLTFKIKLTLTFKVKLALKLENCVRLPVNVIIFEPVGLLT